MQLELKPETAALGIGLVSSHWHLPQPSSSPVASGIYHIIQGHNQDFTVTLLFPLVSMKNVKSTRELRLPRAKWTLLVPQDLVY